MGKIKDLTGQKFGRLTVINRTENNTCNRTSWLCICDCGKTTIATSHNMKNGDKQSCGCYKKEQMKEIFFKDLTGQTFGRLMVIKRVENRKKTTMWLCQCFCGKQIVIASGHLKNGHTQSCGCYKEEKSREIENLVGQIFGYLKVEKRVENYKSPKGEERVKWLCSCKCGNKVEVNANSLKEGYTKSCGCLSESVIASELKKYFLENYKVYTEYKILKNPKTNCYLPYDIYIPYGNNPKINGVYIEINGKQHYEITNWHELQAKRGKRTPEKELKYQKFKDELKKKFAQKNGSYIEIDLRKINSIGQAIEYIEVEKLL
jgi:hypothetical protein